MTIDDLTIPEINYIIDLLQHRELTIKLEHEMFNTMDFINYELMLLKIVMNKCNRINNQRTESKAFTTKEKKTPSLC